MFPTLTIFFIIWSLIGSFLRRLSSISDKRLSLSERSACDYCKNKLSRLELIPIVSWLIQGGKCKSCKAKVPKSYIYSELFSGILCMLWMWFANIMPIYTQATIFLIIVTSIYISFFDIRHKELHVGSYLFLIFAVFISYFSRSQVDWVLPYAQIITMSWVWWWVRWAVWLIGLLVHKLKYNTRGQWFGFWDVLFGLFLGSLLLLLNHILGLHIWVYLIHEENQISWALGLAVWHMLISSILWICIHLLAREGGEMPFIPSMLWWFFILAIGLYMYSEYFILLLW